MKADKKAKEKEEKVVAAPDASASVNGAAEKSEEPIDPNVSQFEIVGCRKIVLICILISGIFQISVSTAEQVVRGWGGSLSP